MQKDVDLDAYYACRADHDENIWLRIANFRADHPVGYRRMTTIRRMRS